MSYGLIAVIIVIGIVIGAIATKKCEPFLIAGSIIGALFLYKQNFITEWVATLEEVMSAEAYLILVCGLFGSIIALLTASKGHFGFAKIVSKICNSERKTLFTTFILGVIIFIDDYLNVLSIGTAMKKVYDKVKVPREALAYLLDSTGSPVCVMFPFSSWAAYFGAIFFAQESVQALGAKTWMGAYIKAIPFCVYPIVALLIVILFSAGLFPKLGGMKKAYDRVAATGKVYSDASKKYNMDDAEGEQDGNILNFLIPMLVLVVVACVTGNLVVAQVICLAVTLVMYLAEKLMTFTEYWDNFVKGFADMLPIIILLIAALTFQTIASNMQMTEFFIDLTQPILSAKIFPMLAFIITGILAFMIDNCMLELYNLEKDGPNYLFRQGFSDGVVQIGAFPRGMAAGTWLSWIVAPKSVILRLEDIKEKRFRTIHILSQKNLLHLLETGELQNYHDSVREKIREDTFSNNYLIQKYLGDIADWNRRASGWCFWLRFKKPINTKLLFESRQGISFNPGFFYDPLDTQHIMLNPPSLTKEQFEEGLKKLREEILYLFPEAFNKG